jgi:hypothetical protein
VSYRATPVEPGISVGPKSSAKPASCSAIIEPKEFKGCIPPSLFTSAPANNGVSSWLRASCRSESGIRVGIFSEFGPRDEFVHSRADPEHCAQGMLLLHLILRLRQLLHATRTRLFWLSSGNCWWWPCCCKRQGWKRRICKFLTSCLGKLFPQSSQAKGLSLVSA